MKRVPNGRSRNTERSLPELSPGSRNNEVGIVSAERSLLRDRSRLTGSVTSLMYASIQRSKHLLKLLTVVLQIVLC